VLSGLRDVMHRENLFDTELLPATGRPLIRPYTARTADGTHNDPADPWMGMAGARFGRNVPIEATFPKTPSQILSPNPVRSAAGC
jgi:hypothetical protein